MRLCLLALVLCAFASCSGKSSKAVDYGVTTSAQLKEMKGEPEALQLKDAAHSAEVLVYPDNEKFQIEKDVVVAGFRNPSAQERSLLYWRHKFKDQETSFQAASSSAVGHLPGEMELKSAEAGITVIYDPNVDAVTRVVEHAK